MAELKLTESLKIYVKSTLNVLKFDIYKKNGVLHYIFYLFLDLYDNMFFKYNNLYTKNSYTIFFILSSSGKWGGFLLQK